MSVDASGLAAQVKAAARSIGFDAVGVAPALKLADGKALRAWLARGFQADMRWMENPDLREDPAALLPGARSVVVAGVNVYAPSRRPAPGEGRLAGYARWADYHRWLRHRLLRLLRAIQVVHPCRGRVAVDAFPVLERALAARAGLGWIGRHACLISPRRGSWLLLGEVILDLEIEIDEPHPFRCGTCMRCAPACPTGAIVEPGVVDARRCIAYLTIELKGPIPRSLRPQVGDWLFGCDLCQEACPWDRFATPAVGMMPRLDAALNAIELLAMSTESFRARFSGTPLMRAGRDRMARNAAVVLGNTRPPGAREALERALGDVSPLVRGHAAWALGRMGIVGPLNTRLAVESNRDVRRELSFALADAGMIGRSS